MSLPKPVDVAGSLDVSMKRSRTSQGEQEPKKQRVEDGCSDPDGQVGFDSLPDELVIKIFSNLSTKDLLTKVARVSKRFHCLSRDPDAHVRFQFGLFWSPHLMPRTQRHAAAAIEFLKGKNKIQEVEMDCLAFPTSMFKLAVMDQKKTTALGLGGDYSTAFKLLRKRPQKAKQIRKLNLEGTNPDCIGWVIPEFVNLVSFDFVCMNGAEQDEDLCEFVVDIAMKSEKLEQIDSSLNLNTDQLKKLLDRHGNRLKALSLSNVFDWSDIWDIGIPQHKFKNLKHLYLNASELSTDSVIGIVQLESLTSLHLDPVNLSPDLLTLILSLVNPKKLEHVELEGFDDYRLTFKNSCLTLKTLWQCKMTADDLSAVLRAAAENKELKKLHILPHRVPHEVWHTDNRVSSTELLLEKGQNFYLRTNSGFMPKKKLAKLIRCLPSSLPPTMTVEIVDDAASSA